MQTLLLNNNAGIRLYLLQNTLPRLNNLRIMTLKFLSGGQ